MRLPGQAQRIGPEPPADRRRSWQHRRALATHAWLKDTSGLSELIDYDFEGMDLNRLYRASDALYKHREALQEHLFGQARSMPR